MKWPLDTWNLILNYNVSYMDLKIFSSNAGISMTTPINWYVSNCVRYMKKIGPNVRHTLEDANFSLLIDIIVIKYIRGFMIKATV